MSDQTATMTMDKGLDHTIIGESTKSFIDGQKGVLEYVGIDIDTLARNSTFEEICFLLWNDRLPTENELTTFCDRLRSHADLSQAMWDALLALPRQAAPMHMLQTMTAMLALEDPDCDNQSREAEEAKALRVLAATPTIIANFDRLRRGLDIVRPLAGDDIATSFLRMLNGTEPGQASARALDVCLILHADHGINASTFAAMVVMGTESDMYSAITAAIGTLRGPLHGGANERVMRMLQDIDGLDAVKDYVLGRLSRKEKVPGFGHRVYKAIDPRATYLKTFAESIAAETGNLELFHMSRRIEEIMESHVGDRGIHPNVDFYSASTYYSLGLAIDLFTPIFAMSRNAGWAAHALERHEDNRLIRPRCQYTGPHGAEWTPLSDR